MAAKKTASSPDKKKKSSVALSLSKKLENISKFEKGEKNASIARDKKLPPSTVFTVIYSADYITEVQYLSQPVEKVLQDFPGYTILILRV